MTHISRITLFPIKSFDGVDVPQADLRPNGSLVHDREYQFVKEDGKALNASANPEDRLLYQVRVRYENADFAHAHFSMPGGENAPTPASFDLRCDVDAASAWMSQALGQKLHLQHESEVAHDFSDRVDELPGPTVVGQATLDAFKTATGHADVMRRLRSNITLQGLRFGGEDGLLAFKIGDLQIDHSVPCVRCPIPASDPETGGFDAKFVTKLHRERLQRQAPNPFFAEQKTHYVASINTRSDHPQSGRIALGDTLDVIKCRESATRGM